MVTYGFFNSVYGDRKYDADQMSDFYTGIVTQGVFQHVDNGLEVTAGTGLTVSVNTGRAIIQNKWVKNDTPLILELAPAPTTYGRFDRVVLKYDSNNRNVQIIVKTGTPAGTPGVPELVREGGIYELCLADIDVEAGATSVTVTDTRSDTTLCGWASVAQATSGEVDQMLDYLKTGYDGAEYSTPAEEVQGSDRKLQNQIDVISEGSNIYVKGTANHKVNESGQFVAASGYRLSDMISVDTYATYITNMSQAHDDLTIAIMDIHGNNPIVTHDSIFTIPQGKGKIALSVYEGSSNIATVKKLSAVDLLARDNVGKCLDVVEIGQEKYVPGTVSYRVADNGSFVYAPGYRLSDFIPVTPGNIYFTNMTAANDALNIAICDANGNNPVVTNASVFTIPEGKAKLAMSVYLPSADNASLKSITAIDTLARRNLNQVFECGSGKDYTTLRSAIEAAVQYRGSKVIVYPGTYDLTSEFATEIANETQMVGDNTGIELKNDVHVLFLPGAYVKALFPTSSKWISIHFAPFFSGGSGFTIENANIEASNCRYCFHDDRSGQGDYHNVFKNCTMKFTLDTSSGATSYFHQCIGGGMGLHGYVEIIGGKYTSVYPSEQNLIAISYHNGYNASAFGKIVIKDAYLDGAGGFQFGDYGTSQLVTPVMISGCSMGAATRHVPETSGSTTVNFEVTEWNCEIRS